MPLSAGDLRYADIDVLIAERDLDAEMLARREELRAATPISFVTRLSLTNATLQALARRFELKGWRLEPCSSLCSGDARQMLDVRLTEEQYQRTGDETV